MKQLDGAGQAKMQTLEEAMLLVQRLHGIVERMAIAVRAQQDLGGFKSQFTRAATPLVGLLKLQFGLVADLVSALILASSRGASAQNRLRAMREGIAQVRTQLEIAIKRTEVVHEVREKGIGNKGIGNRE